MREPYTQLYVHLVWATWDRLPLITPDIEPRLYGHIIRKCRELKCVPIRISGIENHTHLLVRLHTTIAVATLVKEVKGASSHLMTHEIAPDDFFKWQGAYGAFTVRKAEVPQIHEYIANQKQHHRDNSLWDEFEKTEIADEQELAIEADLIELVMGD
jgi:REP element-mobilizing transposase RayT